MKRFTISRTLRVVVTDSVEAESPLEAVEKLKLINPALPANVRLDSGYQKPPRILSIEGIEDERNS